MTTLRREIACMLLAVGAGMIVVPASVSAQTSGADAVKMLDTDHDGTLDLAECKAAAEATFDKLDADKSATLDQQELGDRATITIVPASQHGFMFFETRPSKADYIGFVVKRFDVVDPDHEGKIDAKELDTPAGQALVKLLQ
jgi:EF hand